MIAPTPTKPPTSPLPKHVAKELSALGYKTPDRKDLATFQQARGVKSAVPGVIDTKTHDALRDALAYQKKHESVFQPGQVNGSIRAAETRMKQLGYDTGKVDGVFDKSTASALYAFKKDHPQLHNTARLMGEKVRHLLAQKVGDRAHAPYHVRVKPSKEHTRLDAATHTAVKGEGLTVGARGRAVKNIESRLAAAGFSAQKNDGVFDERTASAVKAFQKHSKLPVTGTVDSATWAQLKKSYVYGKKKPMTAGEHSSSVLKAERTLKKLGYKTVKADGVFDSRTARAVRAFEKKHHLKVNGEISASNLKAMKKAASRGKGADAYDIAKKMVGHSALWLQTHGPLAKFMHDGIPQNVNCANFVSSCLEHAGLISTRQHNDVVSNLADNLRADDDWKNTSLSNAKKGDVCIVAGGDHVVMFAGRDKNGTPLFIGSNNRMDVAGHPQYVSIKPGYSPIEVFHYRG